MPRYAPTALPDDCPPGLKRWLADELRLIAGALPGAVLQLEELGAEPARPRDGMIAYANGTNWNPGAGEGFYGRVNGAWVKL